MQKRTLNNGLKVICYPIEHAMSVEIGLYIRAGARYENKENNGITHLLEHMHFRQLGDMNQKEIYETTEMMGTSLRGTTYKEMLCFNMKVRPKYLEKSLDIFEKILTTYDWTEEQLESEKKVVINEIYEKEDEVTLEKIYDKAIWRKNPLKRGILGSEENVKGFTVDDLVGYKKEIFSKNNVTLVITGAIDEEKSREIFEEFGKIKINEGVERKEKVEVIKRRQFKREPDVKLENFASWNIVDVQLSFDVDLTKIKENELLLIFYSVLPLLIIGQYEEISGTYYYGILRGIREFKFLAQRNFVTSVIKIVIATILSYTVLGIKGVWISYMVYCIVQKLLSKRRYEIIEEQSK